MGSDRATQMRWDPYVLIDDQGFDEFWEHHLSTRERSVLFILGRGFDQRALGALTRICAQGFKPNVWLLAFHNGIQESTRRLQLTDGNHKGLIKLVGVENVLELPIDISSSGFAQATSKNTRKSIGEQHLDVYDDVIVDISAMPRIVALTAVAQLLNDLDNSESTNGKKCNLHVVTAESVATDRHSGVGSLRDEMAMMVGFSGHLTAVTTEPMPRVWFPVLGEDQMERMLLIQDRLDPDEICPVIPFPSRNARRGDDIITQHRMTLFDDFLVEPTNILLASEFNPFEAYKQLFGAMDRYRVSLEELGGCKAFVSPLSSKLLSIGALLACYDHRSGLIQGQRLKVGIPYVETADYDDPQPDDNTAYELYSMWIRGEWEL